MNELTNWMGKDDDMSISYEIGFKKDSLLLRENDKDSKLPVLAFENRDKYRDIVDVKWENNTTNADKMDYLLAIASGTIAGLIDSVFVGEFSLEEANKWGKMKVATFVVKVAKICGYKGEEISGAIEFLERNYKIPADVKTPQYGGGLQHHLRDFTHHFSLVGVFCSIYTQFTQNVVGTDEDGNIKVEKLNEDLYIGKTFEEKLFFGIVTWFFHMVSDMGGSSNTPGHGTGIPGPIVSFIEEIASLKIFKEKKISDIQLNEWVSKLFNGKLITQKDSKGKVIKETRFDFRTEIGLLKEVGKQFIPVLINECLVRTFYFIKSFYNYVKENNIKSIHDLEKDDIINVLPYKNKRINRMCTISCATFTIVDSADAMVRAVVKNKGFNKSTIIDFAIRINYAGIARTIIACKVDIKDIVSELKKNKNNNKELEKEYDETLAKFDYFSIKWENLQLLYSIENLIVLDDIKNTKDKKQKKEKESWLQKWRVKVITQTRISKDMGKKYFLNEKYLKERMDLIEKKELYTIILEVLTFEPYQDEIEKQNIHLESKYLYEEFTKWQNTIDKSELDKILKTYQKSKAKINGRNQAVVIGIAGTAAITATAAGLGSIFAPAIATAIAGGSATGLYGAALTSYSLAMIGGGAIAAGGLGVAGGTTIIMGSSALIGALGSSGISAISVINMLSNDAVVLEECTKILTLCEIMNKDEKGKKEIGEINDSLEYRIDRLEKFLDEEKNYIPKEEKIKNKVANKSVKYMKKCKDGIEKILKK